MTESRLRKYLETSRVTEVGPRRRKPVFFSDSKGNYLLEWAGDESCAVEIDWRNQSGADSGAIIQQAKREVDDLVAKYGRIQVYLWTETCDLPNKLGKFFPKRDPRGAQQRLVNNLLNFEEFIQTKNNVRLTVLCIPYYSIRKHNEHKGHPDPDKYLGDDAELKSIIEGVNGVINQINERGGSKSPKFNLDIERPKKQKGKDIKFKVNWGLFRDGVHPGPLLARTWLRSVCRGIHRDCY